MSTHSRKTLPSALAVGLGVGLVISLVIALSTASDYASLLRLWNALGDLRWVAATLGCLVVLLLMVFRSRRCSRRFKWGLVLALTAVCMTAGYSIRIDGFTGGLAPRLAWRWSPTADEQFSAFQQQTAAQASHLPIESIEWVPTTQDFPEFLGTGRQGIVSSSVLDRNWQSHPPRRLWSQPVGSAWSGFSILGDYAFTQEQRDDTECVVCYALLTGREQWVHADHARFDRPGGHGAGPRATPTLTRSGFVLAQGATGLLNCLDGRTGTLLWQQALIENPDTENLLWGMSGSPLLIDSQVVVASGIGGGRSLQAFDLETGAKRWSAGDRPAAYASLHLATIAGEPQILWFNGDGLSGCDPADGRELWHFPWQTQGDQMVNVAQPLVLSAADNDPAESQVMISSGYDQGVAVVKVTHDADQWMASVVWKNRALKSKFSNLIEHQGHVYGLDNGIMVCLDLANGRQRWKRGRYGHGQLLMVGDVILVQAESGEIVMVAPEPSEHRELGRFPALDSKTWNHPALQGRFLAVRNDRMAAVYELP